MSDVLVIDLFPVWNETVTCCLCGVDCPNTHGLPFDSETGELVSNDFAGDWGAKPACRECHDRHAEQS